MMVDSTKKRSLLGWALFGAGVLLFAIAISCIVAGIMLQIFLQANFWFLTLMVFGLTLPIIAVVFMLMPSILNPKITKENRQEITDEISSGKESDQTKLQEYIKKLWSKQFATIYSIYESTKNSTSEQQQTEERNKALQTLLDAKDEKAILELLEDTNYFYDNLAKKIKGGQLVFGEFLNQFEKGLLNKNVKAPKNKVIKVTTEDLKIFIEALKRNLDKHLQEVRQFKKAAAYYGPKFAKEPYKYREAALQLLISGNYCNCDAEQNRYTCKKAACKKEYDALLKSFQTYILKIFGRAYIYVKWDSDLYNQSYGGPYLKSVKQLKTLLEYQNKPSYLIDNVAIQINKQDGRKLLHLYYDVNFLKDNAENIEKILFGENQDLFSVVKIKTNGKDGDVKNKYIKEITSFFVSSLSDEISKYLNNGSFDKNNKKWQSIIKTKNRKEKLKKLLRLSFCIFLKEGKFKNLKLEKEEFYNEFDEIKTAINSQINAVLNSSKEIALIESGCSKAKIINLLKDVDFYLSYTEKFNSKIKIKNVNGVDKQKREQPKSAYQVYNHGYFNALKEDLKLALQTIDLREQFTKQPDSFRNTVLEFIIAKGESNLNFTCKKPLCQKYFANLLAAFRKDICQVFKGFAPYMDIFRFDVDPNNKQIKTKVKTNKFNFETIFNQVSNDKIAKKCIFAPNFTVFLKQIKNYQQMQMMQTELQFCVNNSEKISKILFLTSQNSSFSYNNFGLCLAKLNQKASRLEKLWRLVHNFCQVQNKNEALPTNVTDLNCLQKLLLDEKVLIAKDIDNRLGNDSIKNRLRYLQEILDLTGLNHIETTCDAFGIINSCKQAKIRNLLFELGNKIFSGIVSQVSEKEDIKQCQSYIQAQIDCLNKIKNNKKNDLDLQDINGVKNAVILYDGVSKLQNTPVELKNEISALKNATLEVAREKFWDKLSEYLIFDIQLGNKATKFKFSKLSSLNSLKNNQIIKISIDQESLNSINSADKEILLNISEIITGTNNNIIISSHNNLTMRKEFEDNFIPLNEGNQKGEIYGKIKDALISAISQFGQVLLHNKANALNHQLVLLTDGALLDICQNHTGARYKNSYLIPESGGTVYWVTANGEALNCECRLSATVENLTKKVINKKNQSDRADKNCFQLSPRELIQLEKNIKSNGGEPHPKTSAIFDFSCQDEIDRKFWDKSRQYHFGKKPKLKISEKNRDEIMQKVFSAGDNKLKVTGIKHLKEDSTLRQVIVVHFDTVKDKGILKPFVFKNDLKFEDYFEGNAAIKPDLQTNIFIGTLANKLEINFSQGQSDNDQCQQSSKQLYIIRGTDVQIDDTELKKLLKHKICLGNAQKKANYNALGKYVLNKLLRIMQTYCLITDADGKVLKNIKSIKKLLTLKNTDNLQIKVTQKNKKLLQGRKSSLVTVLNQLDDIAFVEKYFNFYWRRLKKNYFIHEKVGNFFRGLYKEIFNKYRTALNKKLNEYTLFIQNVNSPDKPNQNQAQISESRPKQLSNQQQTKIKEAQNFLTAIRKCKCMLGKIYPSVATEDITILKKINSLNIAINKSDRNKIKNENPFLSATNTELEKIKTVIERPKKIVDLQRQLTEHLNFLQGIDTNKLLNVKENKRVNEAYQFLEKFQDEYLDYKSELVSTLLKLDNKIKTLTPEKDKQKKDKLTEMTAGYQEMAGKNPPASTVAINNKLNLTDKVNNRLNNLDNLYPKSSDAKILLKNIKVRPETKLYLGKILNDQLEFLKKIKNSQLTIENCETVEKAIQVWRSYEDKIAKLKKPILFINERQNLKSAIMAVVKEKIWQIVKGYFTKENQQITVETQQEQILSNSKLGFFNSNSFKNQIVDTNKVKGIKDESAALVLKAGEIMSKYFTYQIEENPRFLKEVNSLVNKLKQRKQQQQEIREVMNGLIEKVSNTQIQLKK